MKKSDEEKARQPYMYIVQPEISPPASHMQSQYRTVVEQEEAAETIDGDEKESPNEDEIRVVSAEAVRTAEAPLDQNGEGDSVVEVSTGVTDGTEGQEASKRKVIRKPRQQKKKKFSEMTRDELLHFLARMPAAVPKPVCTIYIGGEPFTAQIVKKKGENYILNVHLDEGNQTISIKGSDIGEVIVDNL